MTTIQVHYRAVDGFSKTRSFKTLAGARKFAQGYVGEFPEMGAGYAVAGDGVGRVSVTGATLAELFPAPSAARVDNYPDSEEHAEWEFEQTQIRNAWLRADYIAAL